MDRSRRNRSFHVSPSNTGRPQVSRATPRGPFACPRLNRLSRLEATTLSCSACEIYLFF
jgi:hypothetical protein